MSILTKTQLEKQIKEKETKEKKEEKKKWSELHERMEPFRKIRTTIRKEMNKFDKNLKINDDGLIFFKNEKIGAIGNPHPWYSTNYDNDSYPVSKTFGGYSIQINIDGNNGNFNIDPEYSYTDPVNEVLAFIHEKYYK